MLQVIIRVFFQFILKALKNIRISNRDNEYSEEQLHPDQNNIVFHSIRFKINIQSSASTTENNRKRLEDKHYATRRIEYHGNKLIFRSPDQ